MYMKIYRTSERLQTFSGHESKSVMDPPQIQFNIETLGYAFKPNILNTIKKMIRIELTIKTTQYQKSFCWLDIKRK